MGPGRLRQPKNGKLEEAERDGIAEMADPMTPVVQLGLFEATRVASRRGR